MRGVFKLKGKKEYIRNLQELRGISACLIVISHIPFFQSVIGTSLGGYGVAMFFLLSGFLLIYSTTETIDFFLIKRIIRIIPLYYIVTMITYVLATIKPQWFNTTVATIPNLIKSLLFVPYVNPNGNVRPILDVAWALFPEVWMYIVFYISFRISYKYRALITGSILGTLFAISSIINNKILDQFRLGFLYLLIGIVIFYVWKYIPELKCKVFGKKYKWFMIFIFAIAGVLYNNLIKSQKIYAAVVLVIIVFMYFLLLEGHIVESKLLLKIGSISYCLYLIHEFVVKGISRLLYDLNKINLISFLLSIICILLSIVTAYLINIYIEKPMTNKLKTKLIKDN